MIRRNPRRPINHFSRTKSQDEEHSQKANENEENRKANEESNESDSYSAGEMIADMAQGFVQAQAKLTQEGKNANDNQEIINLLQQLSSQIQQIQKPSSHQSTTSGNNENSANEQKLSNKQQIPSNQGVVQAQSEEEPKKQTNLRQNTVAVQTASQVLAQAQYELANELEASLQKLKQVITESEKIANKISNLLGEESQSSTSGGE